MLEPPMIKATPPMQSLIGWMGSLAETARLRLLRLLEQQELGVAELCEVLVMPQSTVSRHLKLLSDQGWVHARRRATANLYRMIPDELDPVARRLWLLAREELEGSPTFEQDKLRLHQLLEARRSESDAFFESAAEHWDHLRRELYGDQVSTAVAFALTPRDWTIADLGCGAGTLASALAPHAKRVLAVDQNQAMLDAAQRRFESELITNVELRQGKLEATPIDDGECDAAVMALVLTYTVSPEAVVRELTRVLRPGGLAVILDLMAHEQDAFRIEMGQHWPGFPGSELKRMLDAAGLDDVRVRPLPPAPEARGPALCLVTATRPVAGAAGAEGA